MLSAITSDFDEVLGEATESTSRDDAIRVLRELYAKPTDGDRGAHTIIDDCVQACNSRLSYEEGSLKVSSSLGIALVQEQGFVLVHRLEVCLDAIVVRFSLPGGQVLLRKIQISIIRCNTVLFMSLSYTGYLACRFYWNFLR